MNRKVAFLDLRITDEKYRRELVSVVDTVLSHGRLVMGPEVTELESAVAKYCNRRYAVGVGSGTDALFLAIRALDIGPGDEVITTCLSWIATANAIALSGATPVFADVLDDLNINPESVAKLITKKTKAIVPVHYTGKICRMDELLELAKKHDIHVIEDASQAFGATLNSRVSGSMGAIGCFSLNPMKIFAAFGEAGIIVTDRDDLRDRLTSLRYNGTINRETCVEPSLNGRIDTIHAALLLKQLPRVEALVNRRREIADYYNKSLVDVVHVPSQRDGERDVFYTFIVRTPRRDELKAYLESSGIETKIQHPLLMSDQPAYHNAGRSPCPNGSNIVKEILCIPVHEKLVDHDIRYVSSTIHDFFQKR